MPDLHHDLLTDPLIHVRPRGSPGHACTLPGVLGLLVADGLEDFPALRPHQAHPWYIFLVQLAALVLYHGGLTAPPADEATWAALLRELAGGSADPFCLEVADLSRPALLQPPVPEGDLKAFKNMAETADELDMLVTAKNHDVKGARMRRSRPEQWLFSLLTLQTMQGFSGARNYGIARMNGGFASRPMVTLCPGLDWGRRFLRDLDQLLTHREELVQSHGYPAAGGISLLWLEPWDGSSSLPLSRCDPFFIEICRRVRITKVHGLLVARVGSSSAARLDAKERCGDVGDPWTPVDRTGHKALTIPSTGFTYKRAQELLLGNNYQRPLSQRPNPGDSGEMIFWATVLVRGQGKTEGLHQRMVPVPARVSLFLASETQRERLSRWATRRVNIADTARTKVLRPALVMLIQGAPDSPNFADDRPRPWTDLLDLKIDEVFFESLWEHLEQDLDEGQADGLWADAVLSLARQVLEQAMSAVPLPSVRRYRALAAAERVFFGAAKKKLPALSTADPGQPEGAA